MGRGCAVRKATRPPKRFIGRDDARATSADPTPPRAGALSRALEGHPLFFEAVPPGARTSPAAVEARTESLVRVLRAVARVDAVVIPELVDENHDGRPRYRSGDLRPFAASLQERVGREAILNRVVAHLASGPELEVWARETIDRGVRHAVLVGGASRYIPYPGPAVVEADRVCRPIFRAAGGSIGNIAIPQRTGEAHRMLSKTRAGAAFFTTQILFDAEQAIEVIREYDLLCRQAAIPPVAVVPSFAPIVDEIDLEFVEWLGADLSSSAEAAILGGPEGETALRSEARAVEVWDAIASAVRRDGLSVPLGANIEQISPRHLEPAGRLLERFARRSPFTPD